MNQVQTKDKAPEEARVEKEKALMSISNPNDLERFFEDNQEFRDEFLRNPEEAIKKYQDKMVAENPSDKPAETQVPEGDSTTPKSADSNEEIVVAEEDSVKKALDKGRKMEQELDSLQNDTLPQLNAELEKERLRRQQLEQELEKARKESPKPQEPARPKQPKIEIPKFDPEEDLLSETGLQKARKAFAALSALQERNEYLERELEERSKSLKDEMSAVSGRVDANLSRVSEITVKDEHEKHLQRTFEDVDNILKSHKDIFGEVKRSSREIENDYVSFVREVARKSGVNGDVYIEGSNRFRPEVMKALSLYEDGKSDEGKALRERCLKTYPEDFESLKKVYKIAEIRDRFAERDVKGNLVPIAWDKAVNFYVSENPNFVKELQQDASQRARDSRERALENRGNFAKETPPTSGAVAFDPQKVSQAEVLKLLEKPVTQRSTEEKDLVFEVLKMQKDLRPEEARFYAYGKE